MLSNFLHLYTEEKDESKTSLFAVLAIDYFRLERLAEAMALF